LIYWKNFSLPGFSFQRFSKKFEEFYCESF
jgi:hypothetical protein